MADQDAKITMMPTQYINSVPQTASHSASIYKPNDNQIYYLRTSGLSGDEIKKVLEDAFLEEE
jgi:Fe-S cluster assembly scaffold protein SufB